MVTVVVIVVRIFGTVPGLISLGVGALAIAMAAPALAAAFASLVMVAIICGVCAVLVGGGVLAYKLYELKKDGDVQRVLAESFARERAAYIKAVEQIESGSQLPTNEPLRVGCERIDRRTTAPTRKATRSSS